MRGLANGKRPYVSCDVKSRLFPLALIRVWPVCLIANPQQALARAGVHLLSEMGATSGVAKVDDRWVVYDDTQVATTTPATPAVAQAARPP
jgi:hypothetical protein